jgi:hypothetical protein
MTQLAKIEDAALTMQSTNLPARVPWRVQKAANAQTHRGLVQAASIQADAYVAGTRLEAGAFIARYGMHNLAELCKEEAQYPAQAPLSEARFRSIVDTYGKLVNNELAKLAYGR